MFTFDKDFKVKENNIFAEYEGESQSTDNEILEDWKSNLETIQNLTMVSKNIKMLASNSDLDFLYYLTDNIYDEDIPTLLEESPREKLVYTNPYIDKAVEEAMEEELGDYVFGAK